MGEVERFNTLPAVRLEGDLRACLAAPGWGESIAAARPYRDRAAIVAAADAAARALSWDEIAAGLAPHPRIGERAAGDSTEAAWSWRITMWTRSPSW